MAWNLTELWMARPDCMSMCKAAIITFLCCMKCQIGCRSDCTHTLTLRRQDKFLDTSRTATFSLSIWIVFTLSIHDRHFKWDKWDIRGEGCCSECGKALRTGHNCRNVSQCSSSVAVLCSCSCQSGTSYLVTDHLLSVYVYPTFYIQRAASAGFDLLRFHQWTSLEVRRKKTIGCIPQSGDARGL